MMNLKQKYNEWRLIANGFIEEEGQKAYDCGEPSVQENFSEFVGREVNYEEMLELEQEWNKENNWEE